jgi:hypothetical protein
MRNRRRTRLLGALALSLAVALVAAPLAQAKGANPQASVTPTAIAEFAAETREYVAGAAPTSEQLELAAETREYVAGAAPVPSQLTQLGTNPSDGFDWGDAGIGASTVFAVMLLGAGALLVTRQLGRRATV